MSWLWILIAIVSIVCGIVGRIITTRLGSNILVLEDYKESRWQDILEDVLAVILGPIYLILLGLFALLEKLGG